VGGGTHAGFIAMGSIVSALVNVAAGYACACVCVLLMLDLLPWAQS
jgi:hypothetical protein